MLKGAIARRYAAAIFDLAVKQNTLDRTLEEVQKIAQLFAKHKLAFLLREPKISTQRKEQALRAALASSLLPVSLNLALLIVERGLVDLLPNIAAELQQMVLDANNQAVAVVTTAAPMDSTQQRLVQRALERRTGKAILLQTRVNPAILGGVVARVGDQVIDASIEQRLQALKRQLLTGVATNSTDAFSAVNIDIDAANGHQGQAQA
jgi:F-type H+-transporting ATPase subunit delta